MSFFIDVDQSIDELPGEIKVYPLIIKPNGEIYSFDFQFDKIFIKQSGKGESSVLGCAELKNGIDTNEFYRIFEVRPCTAVDYYTYTHEFRNHYTSVHINFLAMEGQIILIKD
jgi:hypothetical protein